MRRQVARDDVRRGDAGSRTGRRGGLGRDGMSSGRCRDGWAGVVGVGRLGSGRGGLDRGEPCGDGSGRDVGVDRTGRRRQG